MFLEFWTLPDKEVHEIEKPSRNAGEGAQGLLVFPLFVLFRLRDILGQNDLLGNLIKLSPENLRSPEN